MLAHVSCCCFIGRLGKGSWTFKPSPPYPRIRAPSNKHKVYKVSINMVMDGPTVKLTLIESGCCCYSPVSRRCWRVSRWAWAVAWRLLAEGRRFRAVGRRAWWVARTCWAVMALGAVLGTRRAVLRWARRVGRGGGRIRSEREKKLLFVSPLLVWSG